MLGLSQLWSLFIFCERWWKTRKFPVQETLFLISSLSLYWNKKYATHTYDVICFEPLQEWGQSRAGLTTFEKLSPISSLNIKLVRDWSEHSHIHIVLQSQYPLQILFTSQGELNLFIFCFRKNVQASKSWNNHWNVPYY